MRLLRSLIFNLAFWLWTTVMMIGCLPALLGPYHWAISAQRAWASGSLGLARVLLGIRYEIRGQEHVPDGPVIIACKHQSTFETILFNIAVHRPAIVLKKELLSLPFYGWYSRRMGAIPVDRKGNTGAMRRMLRAAEKAVAQGRPIVIFPEGSRTAPGQKGPYQPGVAGLYRHLNLPVVPVAIDSGLYWPRRQMVKRPGTIVVEYLPPIPPGLARPDFMATLASRIDAATDQLLRDAGFTPVDGPGCE